MTKKEVGAIIDEIQTLANKVERQTKNNMTPKKK
jgi:hypothetical protein